MNIKRSFFPPPIKELSKQYATRQSYDHHIMYILGIIILYVSLQQLMLGYMYRGASRVCGENELFSFPTDVFENSYTHTQGSESFYKLLAILAGRAGGKVQPDTRIIVMLARRRPPRVSRTTFSFPNFDTDNFLGAPWLCDIIIYCRGTRSKLLCRNGRAT